MDAVSKRHIQMLQHPLPALADPVEHDHRLTAAIAEHFLAGNRLLAAQVRLGKGQGSFELFLKRVKQLDLVARGKLNIDALDRVGVLAHALKRDHHVFIDLERVGMARDRRGARAVEPEFFSCFGADSDKSLAVTGVGHPHDLAGRSGNGRLIVTDDVADEDHLGQDTALALGRVADRAQITFIQMFKAGENGALVAAGALKIRFDLDNRWNGIASLTKKLQANRAHMRWHAMQNPARRGDQPITAFFLNAGQACQELVRDILAKASLAKT